MFRPSSRLVVMAALSVATLFTTVNVASAGHRHRRGANNNGCCGATVAADHCGSSYSSAVAAGYSTGCCGSGSSNVSYPGTSYPYSGQTTVSNRNYSSYGSPTFYPSAGYQNGYQGGYQNGYQGGYQTGYQGNVYNSPGYGSYNNGYGSSGMNSTISTGANVGASVGQAVGGNTGATVGAAIGAAAGAR